MEPYIGQIFLFSGNFAIKGYLECNGALLPINQYQALFSLLGTTYGGDGRITFALPDLRGRVPAGLGQGIGLQNNVTLGEKYGSEQVSLTQQNLPSVTGSVQINGSTDDADTDSPDNALLAVASNPSDPTERLKLYRSATTVTNRVTEQTATFSVTGNAQPIPTVPPTLGLRYLIAVEGLYPPRP